MTLPTTSLRATPSPGLPQSLHALCLDSPIGRLRLVATDEALVGAYLDEPCPPALDAPTSDEGAGHAERVQRGRRQTRSGMTCQVARLGPGKGAALSRDSVLARARDQLAEYFAGEREVFDLPLAPRGTEFQRRVWRALSAIPFGATRSYAAIAAAIGRPSATRAVGAANGKNPLSIIVPCHRVIGADGSLTGYAGGLARKRWLLRHEQAPREANADAARAVLTRAGSA